MEISFKKFLQWRQDLIKNLKETIAIEKVNVKIKCFEELHGNNKMEELYTKYEIMPSPQ